MKVEVIGVIGQGFVGTAVREKFRELFPVMAYDKYNEDLSKTYDSKKSLDHVNTLSDLVDNCDYLFSCVPTPMYEDGECDTRIVESVIMDLHHECIKKEKTVTVVCKSTMTPGTTERLNEISKFVEVLFSPEFLTEANAVEDFKNQNRIILGLPKSRTHNPNTRSLIISTFQKAFPNANVLTIDATEAEMVKYMTNLFLATKVSFFNDMYSYCQKIGANYNVISEVTLLDKRIGNSHYQVPGPDGDRGFGGHCFPKDLSAILFIADKLNINMPTLQGVNSTNELVRKNKDWKEMEGRAVSKRDTNQLEIPLEFNEYGQEHC